MPSSRSPKTLNIDGIEVRVGRTPEGVAEIWGENDVALAAGLGYMHAYDRLTQMMVWRLAGQGRICQYLLDSDETLFLDLGSRVLGFAHHAAAEEARCSEAGRQYADAYCRGVQHYLERRSKPLALKLIGYPTSPWTVADTLLILKVMTYVGLAQGQHDLEKSLLQAIQAGTSVEMLQRLFRPHLDGLDASLVELIRQVKVWIGVLPAGLRFLAGISHYTGSNNWAVAGHRSTTGFPLECHDPHVECNHLPQMWYECVLHTPDDYRIGVTAPGVPGIMMGRNRAMSMSFTYGYMDSLDYFIEECRGGRYRRGDSWHEPSIREETLTRMKHPDVPMRIRDTDLGLLECDPNPANVPDGYYLTFAWTSQREGAAESLDALYHLQAADSAAVALEQCGRMAMSGNWIAADRQGNIGYQQSGRLPRRQNSGLYPLRAWIAADRWQGIVPASELDREFNPPCGFLATANDDRNRPGGPLAVNMSMGSYRVERIVELLGQRERHSPDDMKRMQADLKSRQAALFMKIMRPVLPEDHPLSQLLLAWDLNYDTESKAATLFEQIYVKLVREVFGKQLFGLEAWDAINASTMITLVYFHRFDEVILDDTLADDPQWYGARRRCGLVRDVIAETFAATSVERLKTWGQVRQIKLINLPLGEAFPRLPVLNRGPIALEGGRSSIVQGEIIEIHGQLHAIGPSYRYVCDLGTDVAETALAGGASGWSLSRYYVNDLERWLKHEYKELRGGGRQESGVRNQESPSRHT